MLELLTTRTFARGEADWNVDLAPELQVTLSRRQHVLLSLAAQIPLNHTGDRATRLGFYLLWDWSMAGLTEGW